MSIINPLTEELSHLHVKLYPNYFKKPGDDMGVYIARTDSDAIISIDKLGAALKNRGGYGGDLDDLLDGVKQLIEEMMYQLCSGMTVNLDYFSVYPHIGGTFNSVQDIHEHEKHPVSFRFRANPKMRSLTKIIKVDIEGIANVSGWIDEFTDVEENSVNTLFIPGNQFVLVGHYIKIAGPNPTNGVYLVPVDNPTAAVKVTRIAENSASKIIGIIPQTGYQRNRIEVRTQFTGSGSTVLKTPRIITSSFILEEA